MNKMKVTVNYGAEYNSPQLFYKEVNEVRWRNENWLTIIFTDGETLINASKCYSIDIERDEEKKEGDNIANDINRMA